MASMTACGILMQLFHLTQCVAELKAIKQLLQHIIQLFCSCPLFQLDVSRLEFAS